ncbi:MAG: hypothetical protein K0V04_43785 [Deltaproteobacteria bacterium]|nr:hypothetical protein [Deltaproteobacteria bacterium]
MLAPAITLDAALRDIGSEQLRHRTKATDNIAAALLGELDKPGPLWRACDEHPRGADVRQALLGLLDDQQPPPLRGAAAVALGMLGEPTMFERTARWSQLDGDGEDRAYLRQCSVIAASFLGRAAIDAEADEPLLLQIRERIETAMSAEAPDLRFQAGIALVEIQGAAAEPTLVAALREESHPQAREALVEALAYLDPPGEQACNALESIVEGPEGVEGLGFRAAMVLAAGRRPSARPRLVAGLALRHERDDALEALAALGGGDRSEMERVHRLARRVFLPGITRVRAAYALARMAPQGSADNPGMALLERLRWHPRPAVREAVADAFKNLDNLTASD